MMKIKKHMQAHIKIYAEELKVSMSFSDEEDIVSDLGDLPEDDDGKD